MDGNSLSDNTENMMLPLQKIAENNFNLSLWNEQLKLNV